MTYTTKERKVVHHEIINMGKGGSVPRNASKTVAYNTIEYPVNGLGEDRYPHYTIFFFNEIENSSAGPQTFSSNAHYMRSEQSGTSVILRKMAQGGSNAAVGVDRIVKEWNDGLDKMTPAGQVNNAPEQTPIQVAETALSNVGISVARKAIGLAGKGVTAALDNITELEKKYALSRKRLILAVCLPMPVKVRANYNAGYLATNGVGGVGATILSSLNGTKDLKETAAFALTPVAVGMGVELAKSLASTVGLKSLADAATSGLSESTVAQMVSKISGRVLNKRQEQLFTNMEFRSHQFEYLFIPRSQEESDAVTEIIKQFKMAMHPTLANGMGSSLLITPAEFDIEFRYKDMENDTVSKIATCALKALDVNYTAVGEFIAFEGTTNPVAISLDMTFVEMEPLTRHSIAKGY